MTKIKAKGNVLPALFFAPKESAIYGAKIAHHLGTTLTTIDEQEFDDGENKICLQADVRGRHVFLIQSLYSEAGVHVEQKLCRLLFFARNLKDSSAASVTLVTPYLAYSRQDRRVEAGDPLTSRYVAELFETSGIDEVITLDVHNPSAYENSYRRHTINLEAADLFARYFFTHMKAAVQGEDLVVVSPDFGGMKRARQFADQLGKLSGSFVPLAAVEKLRTREGTSARRLFGDVSGKVVILYDDMISTGSTISHAALLCVDSGAAHVVAAATHGLFCGRANEYLSYSRLEQIIVTDTVDRSGLSRELSEGKLVTLESSPLIASEIRRLYPKDDIERLQVA